MTHQIKKVFLKTSPIDCEISIYEPFEIDSSIAVIIEEINNLGYTTDASCSGLRPDHDKDMQGTPYIIFKAPNFENGNINKEYYFKFLAYALERCGFIPVSVAQSGPITDLIGYMPGTLSDFGVLSKFEALCVMLRKRDFLNMSQKAKS